MMEVASLRHFYNNNYNIKRQNSFIIHYSIDISHSNGSIISHYSIVIHFPLYTGLRFSLKAARPSRRSSVGIHTQ